MNSPTDSPSQRRQEYALLHDARAAHDTTTLSLKEFDVNGVPGWAVAAVTPGPQSGVATIPGAFINGESGQFITPENADTVRLKEGAWTKRAAASGVTLPSQGNYSWTEPLDPPRRKLQPEDYYSPFIHGGTILFRPTPALSGIAWFGPVHLLLPQWDRYIPALFALSEQERSLLGEGERKPDETPRLTQLVGRDNGLIAALAFRSLLRSGLFVQDLMLAQLARTGDHFSAVFCCLILSAPKGKVWDSLAQALMDELKESKDPERIRQGCLGAFTTGLFRSGELHALSRSKAFLDVARQRFLKIGVHLEKEPQLSLIFEKMGTLPR